MRLKIFPLILFAAIQCFFESPIYGPVPMTPFFHKLAFCRHFVTILSQFMMRRRKLYSDDKLNQAIREYYHRTKKVIAVTKLMNVLLNSVEASFKMIIDTCEFAVLALYQLVKNLVCLLKIVLLHFRI